MAEPFRVQCKDCPYAAASESTPVISQPDKLPDNHIGEVTEKVCGDCSLVRENGFCGLRPNSFFYRGSSGQICLDFDEKEASA